MASPVLHKMICSTLRQKALIHFPKFPVENARALCQRLSQGSLNMKILQLDLTCICGEREGLVFEFRVLQIRAQKLTVCEDSQVLVIEQRPGQAVPNPNADTCLQVG